MKTLLSSILLALSLLAINGCHRDKTATAQHLQLFASSDYVPQEVLDGFTKETGIVVDYEPFNTNEAMLQKLGSSPSHYDVIQPSDYMVEHLIKRNMLAPLDRSKLTNFGNILPEYRDFAFDPGNRYSVPYMTGTVGIIVNTKTIKEPVKGYKDVFQASHQGRIVLVDDPREMVTWAMETDGIPINDVTAETLAKVKPTLIEWVKLGNIYADDPKPPLTNGDCDLGIIYSGDAARLWEKDRKFQYILPAEGAHRFVDNLCIPAGSKNKDAAHAFINYVLRPEVSKLISDQFPYTNPNGAARKLLSASQLENPASYPQTAAKLEIFRDIGKSSIDLQDMMSAIRHEGK